MEYHHSQIGTILIIGLLIPLIGVCVVPFLLPIYPPILFLVPLVIAISLAIFYCLNVHISGGNLDVSFGIGIIRKRIPLSEVREARAVENPWMLGWGIRWWPGQYWAWNVSGLRAVELVFKDGSRFRIGTDEPETLVRAIQTNLGSAP